MSFIITKYNGVKVFAFNNIDEFDEYKRFITISKNNRKPLEKCIKIQFNNDLDYIKTIIKKYLNKVLN